MNFQSAITNQINYLALSMTIKINIHSRNFPDIYNIIIIIILFTLYYNSIKIYVLYLICKFIKI